MLVHRERSAREFDLLHSENDRLGKSAPGTLLAERAVADRREHRGADGSIANAPAHATAFVDITHGLFSRTFDQPAYSDMYIVSRWRPLHGCAATCLYAQPALRKEPCQRQVRWRDARIEKRPTMYCGRLVVLLDPQKNTLAIPFCLPSSMGGVPVARYRVIGSGCDSGLVCAKDGRAESRANNRSRLGAEGRQSN